jgi:hypothetical protein
MQNKTLLLKRNSVLTGSKCDCFSEGSYTPTFVFVDKNTTNLLFNEGTVMPFRDLPTQSSLQRLNS